MKYCPKCKEDRSDSDQYCPRCLTELTTRSASERDPIPLPPAPTAAPPVTAPPTSQPSLAAPSSAPPTTETSEPRAHSGPPHDEPSTPTTASLHALPRSRARQSDRQSKSSIDDPKEDRDTSNQDYDQVVKKVQWHLRNGYDLFGLAGHAQSGKTHCLKALGYLLADHGFDITELREKFRTVPVPGTTQAEIFDAAVTRGSSKWVFVDAGGELYQKIQNNDWKSVEPNRTKLTHWLHNCKGLFLFLHLDQGHFNKWLADTDPAEVTSASEGERKRLEDSVEQARDMQKQLEFFGHFLLFLRALKHTDGQAMQIIEECKKGKTLEESLRGYARKAPLLDIPIMFFFTQADTYDQQGFEISAGLHFEPRSLPMSATLFAARHLPEVFSSLLDHARWFKFDFLQSYEEYETGEEDHTGKPFVRTAWQTPEDAVPLSVGLMSGLEFILRHQNQDLPWWRSIGFDTRRSLQVHKLFHPRLWKDIKVDLGRRR